MFKVWDKVRIKSREQMEKEFGLNEDWHIDKTPFSKWMKHLCWITAEIWRIDWIQIWLHNRGHNYYNSYIYTIDMIELIEENKTEQERKPTPLEKMIDYANWCKYCDPQDENERGFNRWIDRVINMFTNYIETSE